MSLPVASRVPLDWFATHPYLTMLIIVGPPAVVAVVALVRYCLRLGFGMWVTHRLASHPEYAAGIITATLRPKPRKHPTLPKNN